MFRFEVLVLTGLLGAPVIALWLRGDFTDQVAATRLLWCLLAAWAAVTLLRQAVQPLPASSPEDGPSPDPGSSEEER